MEKKTERFEMLFEPSILKAIDKAIKGTKTSRAELIRQAVREKLKCQSTVCAEIFNTIKEASLKYTIPAVYIDQCCLHHQKTAGGYTWKYLI